MVVDTVGTFFVLPFLTTLLITTVIWKEMREGHLTRLPLAPGSFAERLPDTRLRRATRIGLLCLLALGPIGAVVLLLLDYGGISIGEFVIYKAIVGIALGMLVTPLIAMVAFGDDPPPEAGRSAMPSSRSSDHGGADQRRSACPPGPGRPASHRPGRHPAVQGRQGGGEEGHGEARTPARRAAGTAVRRGAQGRYTQRAARAAGPRHVRQGRHGAPRGGSDGSAGGAHHLVRPADSRGAPPRLPVADPAPPPRARHRRGLRPLPLRGRRHGSGPRSSPRAPRGRAGTPRSTASRNSSSPATRAS